MGLRHSKGLKKVSVVHPRQVAFQFHKFLPSHRSSKAAENSLDGRSLKRVHAYPLARDIAIGFKYLQWGTDGMVRHAADELMFSGAFNDQIRHVFVDRSERMVTYRISVFDNCHFLFCLPLDLDG
ncbi:hypothetical protein [Pseudomonas sp. FP1740]|uniref:hypothetical protein n=1 Tax=Pseudomonas sp. FP1740 TaxID=2954078 RepID=UPI0027332733|nr:hypothetical protein [Pseudomonas sp. FP1740]WLG43142.1 hypothetical protein PSH69_19920 [Pseudomonas sp. FP1740]